MKQRDFTFLATMPPPQTAPSAILAMCQSEVDALAVAIRAKRGKLSRSWLAKALGISRSYFSEITTGTKQVPDWMVAPLCVLTGSNILAQYRDLQHAMRMVEARESDSMRVERIAAELRRAR